MVPTTYQAEPVVIDASQFLHFVGAGMPEVSPGVVQVPDAIYRAHVKARRAAEKRRRLAQAATRRRGR